ncbi:helix-turn-helix transcriptional regulator [Rhizobium sp. BK376]|uniref:helix-turn-helix transcriptional regulator n=1 Tax=Rhizobium sp. BK376 TaxID=2512149 RepID=UPI00104F0D53|nr:helix-turn-helix transcriptional regulator [Rhizobium sp. BK376]TCR71468.1 hypothetical protein EV561_13338 [Rhizobium sp. BK376]
MDQFSTKLTTAASRRRQARLARGYTLEELAITTGLTVAEIAAAEEPGNEAPEQHVVRIEHVLY